jgi:two-component system sensor histidine kinase RegB
MLQDLRTPDHQQSRQLRLNTLIRLRWLAIIGQSAAVLVVAYWFMFPLPVGLCLALIACSAWVNLFLAFRYPATHRLKPAAAFGVLFLDVLQLAGLLYLTGGLTNPFAILMAVPVIVSATSLPLVLTAVLGLVVAAAASILVSFHLPLPWYGGSNLAMPFLYVIGMWMAILSTTAFTAIYAWRVAEEARQLATALAATELVLQRAACHHRPGGARDGAGPGERPALSRRRHPAQVAERAVQGDPAAADQPVLAGRGTYGADDADGDGRGRDRPASRFRHRHPPRTGHA